MKRPRSCSSSDASAVPALGHLAATAAMATFAAFAALFGTPPAGAQSAASEAPAPPPAAAAAAPAVAGAATGTSAGTATPADAATAPDATDPAAAGEPRESAPSTAAPPAAASSPDAEALARDYRRTGRPAAVDRDRAVLFPFGHGHPALRCAPLRACALELEPGELVLSTSSGDSERWLVEVVATGPGAKTPLVVVKPTACDLTTNLLVATDRRLYEVSLEAPPCRDADAGKSGAYNPQLSYTGVTRFYYPDDLVRRWTREEEAARKAETERSAGTLPLAATQLTSLNFAYTWDRDRRFPWTPVQVFDDGRHTFIVLPPGARSAEAPALFLAMPEGRLALLNYRVENGTYVADRVLDHAVLTVAAGHAKSPYRLEIVNHARASH
jgi:P-type conjugative transfer protein TrbG